MKRFVKLTAMVSSLTVLAGLIGAQSGYTPGQVFGTQRNATRPTATPSPVYRVPVYTPSPATPRTTPVSAVTKPAKAVATKRSSSLYNIKESETQTEKAPKPKPIKKVELTAEVKKPDSVRPVTVSSTSVAASHAVPVVDSAEKIVISRRRTGQKFVALTYDDGPNPAYTPKLMEYLKENGVPATFFLCGNMVKNHPEIVKRLADNGFELANHSYDHPQLTKLSRDGIIKQLQDTHDLIKNASGVDVKLMRPPFGAQNETVRSVCESMGYKVILWDVDTLDWKKRPVELIVSTIIKETGDGSIILMHDRLHGGKDTVLESTREAVEQLRGRGYKFVTVGELLSFDAGTGVMVSPAVTQQAIPTTGTMTVETPGLPIPLVPVVTNGVTSGVLP